MELLLAARTRHHDPAHQHRVPLLLLGDLERRQTPTVSRNVTWSKASRFIPGLYLHERSRRERGEVGRDPSPRSVADDVFRYLVLRRGNRGAVTVAATVASHWLGACSYLQSVQGAAEGL